MIPISSNISRVIREVLLCYETGMKWDEARERIVTIFGHHQLCNAIPTHGFTIIGLLYGKDYGDKLCKAVNCGYDTDCTGATLGSLLGIIYETSIIPEEWRKPIGDAIKPCKFTMTEGLPQTLQELTVRPNLQKRYLFPKTFFHCCFAMKRYRIYSLLISIQQWKIWVALR